jgi:ankyrin repeat protein
MHNIYDFALKVNGKRAEANDRGGGGGGMGQEGGGIQIVTMGQNGIEIQNFNPGGYTVIEPEEEGKMIEDSKDDDEAASAEGVITVMVGEDTLELKTVNEPNLDGWTPLHSCCHSKEATQAAMTLIDEIVKTQGDLDTKTLRGPGGFTSGWTPLHIACAYGLDEIAAKLVACGADANVTNSSNWTPLHDACHRGFVEIASILVQAGAAYDTFCPPSSMCPSHSQCALAHAARRGHPEIVKLLLNAGADKNAQNPDGWTALHEACYYDQVEPVKTLLVYGADPNLKTRLDMTAYNLADVPEIVEVLKEMAPLSCEHVPRPGTDGAMIEAGADAGSSPSSRKEKEKRAKARSPSKRTEEQKVDDEEQKEDPDKYRLLGALPSFESPQTTPDKEQRERERRKKKKNKEKKNQKPATPPPNAPKEFLCSISGALMTDCVKSPYGHLYERRAIKSWLHKHGSKCPLTGQPLALSELVSERTVQNEIEEWHIKDVMSKMKLPEDGTEGASQAEDDPYDF